MALPRSEEVVAVNYHPTEGNCLCMGVCKCIQQDPDDDKSPIYVEDYENWIIAFHNDVRVPEACAIAPTPQPTLARQLGSNAASNADLDVDSAVLIKVSLIVLALIVLAIVALKSVCAVHRALSAAAVKPIGCRCSSPCLHPMPCADLERTSLRVTATAGTSGAGLPRCRERHGGSSAALIVTRAWNHGVARRHAAWSWAHGTTAASVRRPG